MSEEEKGEEKVEKRAKAIRSQLVTIIAVSEFGRRRYTDPEAYKPVCLALGIHAALLRQAVILARKSNPADIFGKDKQVTFQLRLSDEQIAATRELCAERKWTVTGFLRTLMDRFLHEDKDPVTLVPAKTLRTRYRPQIDRKGGAVRYRHDLRVPPTMRQAFNARCLVMGLEASVVLRAILLDVLSGKRAPPDRLLARAELKARSRDYLVPEVFDFG